MHCFQYLQEWPVPQAAQRAQPSTVGIMPNEAALRSFPSEAGGGEAPEGSEGSDVAETLGLWWHGHFIQAGRSGSAYASFASEAKVGFIWNFP